MWGSEMGILMAVIETYAMMPSGSIEVIQCMENVL